MHFTTSYIMYNYILMHSSLSNKILPHRTAPTRLKQKAHHSKQDVDPKPIQILALVLVLLQRVGAVYAVYDNPLDQFFPGAQLSH